MWLAVVMGLMGLASLAFAAWWLRRRRQRLGDDPVTRDALDCWRHLSGRQRTVRLQAISGANPDAGVVWYLLGLSLLAEGRRAPGIRALQVSYHREPAFETAALLVFAFEKLGDTCFLSNCRTLRAYRRTRGGTLPHGLTSLRLSPPTFSHGASGRTSSERARQKPERPVSAGRRR